MGDPTEGLAWACSQPVLQAGSTTDQLGEVMFARDSAFSSAAGCDINALIGSKGGCRCERIKHRGETALTEHLFCPRHDITEVLQSEKDYYL